MIEDKDMNINYIRSKENSAYIMMNNCSEDNYTKHKKSITEEEI